MLAKGGKLRRNFLASLATSNLSFGKNNKSVTNAHRIKNPLSRLIFRSLSEFRDSVRLLLGCSLKAFVEKGERGNSDGFAS